jgi:hypothetical protein
VPTAAALTRVKSASPGVLERLVLDLLVATVGYHSHSNVTFVQPDDQQAFGTLSRRFRAMAGLSKEALAEKPE